MTIAIIYAACAVVCSLSLWAWFGIDGSSDVVKVVLFSFVWPLVMMVALGFAAGVALGWLEGLVP